MKWISIEERLPDYDIDVLVYCEQLETYLSYNKGDKYFALDSYTKWSDLTSAFRTEKYFPAKITYWAEILTPFADSTIVCPEYPLGTLWQDDSSLRDDEKVDFYIKIDNKEKPWKFAYRDMPFKSFTGVKINYPPK